MQQRADHADRGDLVGGIELRPAGVAAVAGAGAEERVGAARVHFVAELHAGVERRVAVDVPVDARDLVVTRLLELVLVGVVVLPGARRVGRVRQREQVEHLLPDAVDAARRDACCSAKQPGPPVVELHASPCAASCGSLIQSRWPRLSTVCEKSPARSSAVGIVLSCSVPGSFLGSRSCEKKKNSLSRLPLKPVPGTSTGPPIVQAVLSNRYGALAQLGTRSAGVPAATPASHWRRRSQLLVLNFSLRL